MKKSTVIGAGSDYDPMWFVPGTAPGDQAIITNNFTGDQIVVTNSFSETHYYRNSSRIDCEISGSSDHDVTIYIIAPETKIKVDNYTVNNNFDLVFGNIKIIIYSRNDISDRPIRIFCGTYQGKEIFFKGDTTQEKDFINTIETDASFTATNILPLLLKNETGNNYHALNQIGDDCYRWGNEYIVRWSPTMTNYYEYVVNFNGFCTERVGDEYQICKSGPCPAIIGQEKTTIDLISLSEKTFEGDIKISVKDITYKKYRPRWCRSEILVNNFTPIENQVVVDIDIGISGNFNGEEHTWTNGEIAYMGSDEIHRYINGEFIVEQVQNPGTNRIVRVNYVFGDTIPVYGSIVKKQTSESFYYYERIRDDQGEEIVNYYEPSDIVVNNGNFDFRGFKLDNPNVEAFLIFCGFTIDQWAYRNTTNSEPNRMKNLIIVGNKKINRSSPLDDFITIDEIQYPINSFPRRINGTWYTYDQNTNQQLITKSADRNGFYFDLDFEDMKNYTLTNLKEIKKGEIFIGVSLIDKNQNGVITLEKCLYLIN